MSAGGYPTLTEDGRALLQNARAVADQMDGFKARARTLREGLEPELSLSIDVMYPMSELIEPVARFRDTFPHTPLRLFVEVLGAVKEDTRRARADDRLPRGQLSFPSRARQGKIRL